MVGKKTQTMLCTHCNKTNHTIENYYFKCRFSLGYNSKTQVAIIRSSNASTTQEGISSQHNQNPRVPPMNCSSSLLFSLLKDDCQHLINLVKSLHVSSSYSVTHIMFSD